MSKRIPDPDTTPPARQAVSRSSRRAFLRRIVYGLSLASLNSVLQACGAALGSPADTASQPSPRLPTASVPSSWLATAEPSAPPATLTHTPTQTPPTPTPLSAPVRFAVIGDYGLSGEPEQAVAALVQSWQPDFIVSTGDNNYPHGSAETIDENIGQYYQAYIAPYQGRYGAGAATNQFFPVLGNHDWEQGTPQPYLDYFTLPEPYRYYTFAWQDIRFFALDSALDEPDGVSADSKQAQWLQHELAAAQERWKIVVFHHAPFSSGLHGSSAWMQWPFAEWGVDLVLAGHDHDYERIMRDGLPYLVNGLGGGARYAPGSSVIVGSELFYNQDHGALRIEITATSIVSQFITRTSELIDTYRREKA